MLTAMKRYTLHRYNFFLSVKSFIAVTFYEKTSFKASSLLLFKRNSSLIASFPLLFKVTLPTSGAKLVRLSTASPVKLDLLCVTLWFIYVGIACD